MAYTVLSGSEGLRAVRAAWETLEKRVPVHVFQTYTFGRLWYDTVGAQSKARPLIVVLQEEGSVLGIFPACLVPYGPIKLLTWLGAPLLLDYSDILWDPSASISPESFIVDSLKLLRKEARNAFLYLTNVRDDAAAYSALTELMIPYKRTTAPHVEIPTAFDQYLESLGKGGRRRTIRRHMRRLEAAGAVSFEVLDKSSPGIDETLTWVLEMKKARYKGRRGRADLYLPGHEEFRRAQVREQPGMRVSRLAIDGTTIAADISCLHNGRLYGMVTAFDPKASSLAPGLVLTAYIVEHCSESGVHVLDLGWGDEPFKYMFTDQDVGMTTFVNDSVRGRLIKRIAGTRRALTQRIRGEARRQRHQAPSQPEGDRL